MSQILSMQKAFLKKTITEIVARQATPLKNLPQQVAKKLTPNVALTAEEKNYINEVIFTMLTEGSINSDAGVIQTKTRYRVNSVEEDYMLNIDETTHHFLKTAGDVDTYTVGSERKPYLWAKLNRGASYTTILIPEPENRKDPNAVAVCINGQPFAYLDRDTAKQYSPILNTMFEHKIVLTVDANIVEHPDNVELECFKLSLPDRNQLLTKIQNLQ